ncbi:LuxR family transcriptional regulator [Novosphingobium umbonatum]|uniref:LuxR family transcriptional regulator n=1 Tax=Novosphingobium umbonatum TaxID=1908524 RepID=A0A3S2X6V4_9SPHN|nr:helix-turn-helix transcriptional regulator [Novosphingobium umbonatum]RVU07146.1 LuxR family transcriptional regulator [Novosphingobium umbonatum]
MGRATTVQDLRETFLAAPLTQGGWELALRDMARLTNSARGQLIAFDGGPIFTLDIITNLDGNDFQRKFVEINGGNPNVNWRVHCSGEPLELIYEHHYDEAHKRQRFDLYDDFAHDADMSFGMQAVLQQERGSFFGLATLRTREDGPSSEDDRAIFGGILTAAQTAVRLQRNLAHQGSLLLAGALEAMDASVILLNRYGRMMGHTRCAQAALSSQSHLRSANGKIFATSPRSDRKLQAAIARVHKAVERGDFPTPQLVWLETATDDLAAGVICEIFGLPRQDWSLGERPHLLINLKQPAQFDERHVAVLREAIGFSPSEAEVALQLAKGMDREGIASSRQVSPETVHTQMKHIYRKTGMHNAGELIAFLRDML